MQLSVRDLMTTQPARIHELASIAEAQRVLLDQAVSQIYVTDADDRLLGVVSDFELLKFSLLQGEKAQPVKQLMSRRVPVLTPDMSFESVMSLFRESCCSLMAVMEDGRLAGELSRRDVLRTLAVLDELNSESGRMTSIRIEDSEKHYPPRPQHVRSSELRSTTTFVPGR